MPPVPVGSFNDEFHAREASPLAKGGDQREVCLLQSRAVGRQDPSRAAPQVNAQDRRAPPQCDRRIVEHRDVPLGVAGKKCRWQRVQHLFEVTFLGRQISLKTQLGRAVGRFQQFTGHHRAEPRHIAFEHVIICAELQGLNGNLLADRPGHQHKRNIGIHIPNDLQGSQTIESRQVVVGHHGVERVGLQNGAQCLRIVNLLMFDLEVVPGQGIEDQPGVVRRVLDQQKS